MPSLNSTIKETKDPGSHHNPSLRASRAAALGAYVIVFTNTSTEPRSRGLGIRA
jgi:hypothetical protein